MFHVKQFSQSLKERFKRFDLGGLSTLTFLIFVFSIPIQKRIEFYNAHTFDYGSFIDYTTPLLYLNDFIFIAATLFLLANAFVKKRNPFSGFKSFYGLTLLVFLATILPTLFLNQSPTSFIFFGQLALMLAFSLATYTLVVRTKGSLIYLYPLVAAGVYQSIIAITQFTLQSSTGLTILGESPFSINIQNVAKIVVSGARYIRAYGTFPHPNVLASFLGVSLALTLLFFFLARKALLTKPHKAAAWITLILIQAVALLLTFSRSSWLASLVPIGFVFAYCLVQNSRYKANDPLTERKFKASLVILCISIAILAICFSQFVLSRATITDSNGDSAVTERSLLVHVSRETFREHPIAGSGLHSFLEDVKKYSQSHKLDLDYWQFQPVHNIYALIATESGFAGLAGFFVPIGYVAWLIVKKAGTLDPSAKLQVYFGAAALCALLIEGLFDHHVWDIHQSQLLFWFLLGLTAGSANVSRETPVAEYHTNTKR
jgi:O-antigen ligase